MKYLITCMGNSDPIREQHDSAILHICRHERPEVIIVIHSERSKSRHNLLERALESIPGYHYTLESWATVIPNETVPLFDKVYDFLNREIQKIKKDKRFTIQDEIILNITSGTPQMISALAVINRLEEYGFRAIQVTTPLEDSNTGSESEKKSIEELIAENMDATVGQKNRCHEDLGENVRRLILSNNLKKIIQNYDYKAAALLLNEFATFPNRESLLNLLNEAYQTIQLQQLPERIKKLRCDDSTKRIIFFMSILNMSWKRGDVAEVLIRIKSIVEFAMHTYIDLYANDQRNGRKWNRYIKPKTGDRRFFTDKAVEILEREGSYNSKNYTEWPTLKIIYFESLKDNKMGGLSRYNEWWKQIDAINDMRNKVAHNLDPISHEDYNATLRLVELALEATNELILNSFKVNKEWLQHYDSVNESLRSLLP